MTVKIEPSVRSKYVDYIADVIRNTTAECGLRWPDNTIIVTKSDIDLASIDEIAGLRIFVGDFFAPCDFFFSIPASDDAGRRLLRAARDYMELYPL
jgi:hypothetical protein